MLWPAPCDVFLARVLVVTHMCVYVCIGTYVGTFECGELHPTGASVRKGITAMAKYVSKGRPARVIVDKSAVSVIDARSGKVK